MNLRRSAIALVALAWIGCSPAIAESDCTGFAWPMAREKTLFAEAPIETTPSGGDLTVFPTGAIRLALVSAPDFKVAPERAPKTQNPRGGWVSLPAPPTAGTYQVTLEHRGWIDVIQSGATVKSGEFSSDKSCATMHKSVRFALAAEPIVIQISDVEADSTILTILPVEPN